MVSAQDSGESPKPFFEIGADGEIGGVDDGLDVAEHGVAADGAIGQARGEGVAGGGGGEGFEAEAGEEAGGACVPWVGDEEGAVALVQCAESVGLVCLGGHAVLLRIWS